MASEEVKWIEKMIMLTYLALITDESINITHKITLIIIFILIYYIVKKDGQQYYAEINGSN